MNTVRSSKVPGGLIGALLVGLLAVPVIAGATTGYYAQNGKIYDPASQEIQVRGISHFGFNADILQPQYLWQMGWKEQIAQIKSLGFNAVRVPFVPDTLYVTTKVNQLSYVDPNKNPELMDKTPLQVLDLWMAEADRQGLYVMLDFHSLSKVNQYQTWFNEDPNAYGAGKWAATWNGQPYTVDHWKRDLAFVAARYAHLPYFFAMDIFNEPQQIVRWSTGDTNSTNPKYYWKPAAEGAAAAVLAANPRLLIFVQGINANYDGIEKPNIPINWGENFQPQAYQPLNIPYDKLVLSPHTYGPDVYQKSSFSASNYPANLAADWETLFGQFSPQHPVIVGEWGGRYGQGGTGQADVAWQNAFVDYLLGKNIRSSFYWCYTPNSGDTGGILDDNLSVRQDKMELLRRHWGAAPAPTPAPTPAPQPGTLSATFSPSPNVNEWWVEVHVESSRTLNAVHAQVNGGSWTSLPETTWGTWAKSYFIAAGSSVVFRATATDGATATSRVYTWLQGSPAPAPEPAPAAGTLVLSASSYSVAQATGSVTVQVKRTGGSTGKVSLRYATANGSASAGRDYTAKSGTLSWTRGDTATKSISIPVSKATPFSGSRSFSLTLSNATGGAVLGTPATASVTINGSKPAPAPGYVAPYIQSFSPASGPPGTVVTVLGSGFTGVNSAWVGDAHDAPVSVVSDTQVRVTIPAGATSGAIGIFNPAGASFTASSFTVTSGPQTYVAPYIMNFSPASGPVGTVVTLNGSGFTGLYNAWVGDSRQASVAVVSDTQAQVTVPADATTGAIGLFNPAGVSFTASSFTRSP